MKFSVSSHTLVVSLFFIAGIFLGISGNLLFLVPFIGLPLYIFVHHYNEHASFFDTLKIMTVHLMIFFFIVSIFGFIIASIIGYVLAAYAIISYHKKL